jgi:hypothetical protein
LTGLATTSLAAEKPAPETKIVPCETTSPRIEINGATGSLVTQKESSIRPGGTVCIVVYGVNVADYEFELDVRREHIEIYYPIVGVEKPVEAPTSDAIGKAGTPSLGEYKKRLDTAANGLESLREKVKDAGNSIRQDRSELSEKLKETCKTAAICEWPADWNKASFAAVEAARVALAGMDKELLGLETDLDVRVRALLLGGGNTLEWTSAKADEAKAIVTTLKEKVSAVRPAVGGALKTVERWKAAPEKPLVEMGYRLARGNQCYIGTVSATALDDPTAGDAFSRAFAFEAHERALFGVSVGIAGLSKPRSDFSLVASQSEEEKIVYTVRGTDGHQLDPKLFVSLALYLGTVDMADPRRGGKPFVFLGSDIKTTPEAFYFGVGLDFPSGFQISLIGTRYETKRLADGWTVDQPIKTTDADKNPPLIATVPTTSHGQLGLGVGVSFRPAIVKALKELLK